MPTEWESAVGVTVAYWEGGLSPKLSTLGSTDWTNTKRKTKRKIKEAARELIELYAKRKAAKGFKFGPDTVWQKELEASFMYEDTPDQLSVSADVKIDMEVENPMDRLVCGDVGFGKTEIAVRAAFKAVQDGKQTALLVPTTILAEQHFNTFKDRLTQFPVKVGMLSRFQTPKEQTITLEELEVGKVDIVIGTHRLLSKDIKFNDLGLLIIDEEHRFGVSAKEKLRSIKVNVDTLTLTATPIPRTLNLSLLGARDLSIIATPPPNRQPIITNVSTFDILKIREWILSELKRSGQVYFVHDRVHSIDKFADYLSKHIPDINIGKDGKFSYSITLPKGARDINIRAVDKAGNETLVKRKIIYWKLGIQVQPRIEIYQMNHHFEEILLANLRIL